MLCGLCNGAQNITFPQLRANGSVDREWHSCPMCGGAGVRLVAGPPEIGPGWRRRRPLGEASSVR